MDTLRGKTILVTGGAGFIGAHLVHRLVREGAEVHVLVRNKNNVVRLTDILSLITLHEGDITDESLLKELFFTHRFNGVFHLAAASQSFGHIPTTEDLVETNILSTIRLMDIAQEANVSFFVNTGTFAEVGSKDHPVREDDVCEPTEFYSISRIPATLYAQAFGRTKKLPFATVRVFTPYGPAMQRGKILHEMITSVLEGRDIVLTSPEVNRDFIFVDDLVEIYIRVALKAKDAPGIIVNGGTGVTTTLRELSNIVLELTASKSKVIFGSTPASYDLANWRADIGRVKEMLSFTPRIALREGVEKTVLWYSEHQDFWLTNNA